jgi:hypothetical protein
MMDLSTDRSQFVPVVAWVFIVLAAISFASGAGALGRTLVAVYFTPVNEGVSADYPMASFLSWALEVTPQRALVFLAVWTFVSALVLVTSIGLVKRQGWARRAFVVWMCVAALMTAFSTVNSIWFLFAIDLIASPDGKLLFYTSQVLGIILQIGMVVMFIWIIQRLRDPNVVAEFR